MQEIMFYLLCKISQTKPKAMLAFQLLLGGVMVLITKYKLNTDFTYSTRAYELMAALRWLP